MAKQFKSHKPDKIDKSLIENYPRVVRDIDKLVSEIEDFIKVLPPEDILLRAWWEMAALYMKIETETGANEEEVTSLRMIDYVQSMIAAVSPSKAQRDKVTDEEWEKLRNLIKNLFDTINHTYFLCQTAKNMNNDPDIDIAFEEFRFKAQLYWCNVRGKRYQVHQKIYLEEMLLPHSNIIQEIFGISGEDFVAEINKIWQTMSFGIIDAFNDLKQFHRDVMDIVERKINDSSLDSEFNLSNLINEIVKENAWEDRRDEIEKCLWGTKLFDVQEMTSLPENLLEVLAWRPGEDKEFLAAGEFRGWPLRIWPVFKRPFIRLEGRYYCFDIYSLFDNLYRVMQRIIFRLKPDYKEVWNTIQQNQSEGLPFKYFERLLPGAKMLKQVHYRIQTGERGTNWCETDGLIIYDDHLFVVEARAGSFTYTSPATDFEAHIASIKNLVWKPAMQGSRFLSYLNSAENVPLFDSHHNQIDRISKSDFRHITICAVTVDPFTEIAAQIQHLHKIGVDVGAEPVWAISLDDLRVYVDIFDNPLIFLHFVEQRMQAFQSENIQCDDELDHLGLYLEYNHYSSYIEQLHRDSGAQIILLGYRSDIDKFFYDQMFSTDTLSPPKQDIPIRILEIIQVLSRSDKRGRAEIVSCILDCEADLRVSIENKIYKKLICQPTGSRQSLGMNHGERYLLIELIYSVINELQDIHWTWELAEGLADIPSDRSPNLRLQPSDLRKKRIDQVKTDNQKVGRNESCPCGSGKKYKRCCLGRR